MINYAARLPALVLELELVRDSPFTLIDVGCSGGIHSIFDRFGSNLVAHGFDPVIPECERLADAERRPGVRYQAAFVRNAAPRSAAHPPRFIDDLPDTSAGAALGASVQDDIRRNLAPSGELSRVQLSLDDVMEREGLTYVDFLKVDVDGTDLDVLQSGHRAFREARVGAVATEVAFTGGGEPDDNAFHNVDRLLRRHGMELANLEVWRYSLKELPSRFRFRAVGETMFGPPFQGDAIYFNPDAPKSVSDLPQRAAAVLKQAAVLDLFCVPDCAAKLLLANEKALTECGVPLGPLLDALVPGDASYAAHMETFRSDPMAFFPADNPSILADIR